MYLDLIYSPQFFPDYLHFLAHPTLKLFLRSQDRFVLLKASWICGLHWGVFNLLGSPPLEKTLSPSSRSWQLLMAPWLEGKILCSTPISMLKLSLTWDWIGLMYSVTPTVSSHAPAVTLLSRRQVPYIPLPPHLVLVFSQSPGLQWSLSLGRRYVGINVLIRAENSTISYSLHLR